MNRFRNVINAAQTAALVCLLSACATSSDVQTAPAVAATDAQPKATEQIILTGSRLPATSSDRALRQLDGGQLERGRAPLSGRPL